MDEDARKQVITHLDELRSQVEQVEQGENREHHEDQPVLAHVEELRTLVQEGASGTKESAGSLEQKLLAWEAEHPQIVALAARVARALEDAGL